MRARQLIATLTVVCAGFAAGCALTPDFFRESGPSTWMPHDSATSADIYARYEPAPLRVRDWRPVAIAPETGATEHYPLYFEDPFEDKGHGRTDETHPNNVYRAGWEDYLALAYSYSRFTLNWIALPVSAVVTPPCTVMVSDGQVSKQALGYDHDAIPLKTVRAQYDELERTGRVIESPPEDAEAPAAPAELE